MLTRLHESAGMPRAYSTVRRTTPILRDGPCRPNYLHDLLSCCDPSPTFDSCIMFTRPYLTSCYGLTWRYLSCVRPEDPALLGSNRSAERIAIRLTGRACR